MAEYHSTVRPGCLLLSIPPDNGHLGDFRFLTAVNRAAVNIHVHVRTRPSDTWFCVPAPGGSSGPTEVVLPY